ncbi:DUF1616 domain-containing protein [Halorubellus salinus]|uniref:DUF1616 domain-containing protein n=1 Tax=Halorubellus salinus TaxID=755309 RepID=UPI001D06D907|nr:DUF1616 domain-containing protein [Halorubellus salinus]
MVNDDRALTETGSQVLVAALFVLAVGSVFAVASSPTPPETDLFVVTQDADGSYVASDYPETMTRNESERVFVGITNEHRQSTVTVVVLLERVQNETNGFEVVESEERKRMTVALRPGETRYLPYDISPSMTGDRLRVRFLLYEDSPSAQPTVERAHRDVYLWVNVTNDDASNSSL